MAHSFRALKCALSFCLLLYALPSYAQHLKLVAWSQDTLDAANTAKDVAFLKQEEKNIILFLNMARLNPDLFARTVVANYFDTIKANPAQRSLLRDLHTAKPMPVLEFDKGLYQVADRHAKDMGETGKAGHRSSSGQSFTKRIAKSGKWLGSGECCDYGNDNALDIVMSLLVDEGVKDYEHRKIMLNPNYSFVGAALEPHKKYGWNAVIDMGSRKK